MRPARSGYEPLHRPAEPARRPLGSRRGWWIVAAAALAASLLTPKPAGAAQVSLMPREGAPARAITVLGVGYRRKALVRVRVANRVRRVRTGPRGRFAVVIR